VARLKENPALTQVFRAPHCTRAKISALGTYVPPKILTNADLEKLVETNDQWITERTGIKERHILEKGLGTSDMAADAARRGLAALRLRSWKRLLSAR
jgi:3-oxoacyl-[acyl-carrier-protein] synthase-3